MISSPRARLHAAELLHQHARHPERVPADGRTGGVRDPGDPGGHDVAGLGVYSGYELFESVAVRPGSEEVPSTPRSTNSGRATSPPPPRPDGRWRRY